MRWSRQPKHSSGRALMFTSHPTYSKPIPFPKSVRRVRPDGFSCQSLRLSLLSSFAGLSACEKELKRNVLLSRGPLASLGLQDAILGPFRLKRISASGHALRHILGKGNPACANSFGSGRLCLLHEIHAKCLVPIRNLADLASRHHNLCMVGHISIEIARPSRINHHPRDRVDKGQF